MSVFNSMSVAVLIVLLTAGLITGLSVSGVDLLNPQTATAEANRMQVDTNHQEALYQQEERLNEKEIAAQIQTIDRQQGLADAEADHTKEMLAQNARNTERLAIVWSQFLDQMGKAVSISFAGMVILLAASRAIAYIKAAPTGSPNRAAAPASADSGSQRMRQYWRAKIDEARNQERIERQAELIVRKRDEQLEKPQRNQLGNNDPAKLGKKKYGDLPHGE